MNTPQYLTRLVNLRPAERNMVQEYIRKNQLGTGGFSAALRAMLQEWALFQRTLSSLPYDERKQLKAWLAAVRPQIAREDRALEGSGMEIEYPAGESSQKQPWENSSSPRPPIDEYETALFKLHGGKYTTDEEEKQTTD
jgi:hypothetical protein